MNINFKLTKGKHMKLINLFFLLIFTTIALITLSNMVGCYKTSAAHTVTANNLKIETSEFTNRPSINFEKPKKQKYNKSKFKHKSTQKKKFNKQSDYRKSANRKK